MSSSFRFGRHGLALVAAVGLLSGCATITGGTTDNVRIETDPGEASARVGTSQCETPCTMTIPRDATDIQIEKDGYEPLELQMEKSFRAVPTILGNILWLVPGLAVDFLAGGAYDPQPVNVQLESAADGDAPVLRLELEPRNRDGKRDQSDEDGGEP